MQADHSKCERGKDHKNQGQLIGSASLTVRFQLPNNSGWDAGNKCVPWNVFVYERSGRNDRTFSNGDATKDSCSCPYPHALFNDYGETESFATSPRRGADLVMGSDERGLQPNNNVVFNSNRCSQIEECTLIDKAALSHSKGPDV